MSATLTKINATIDLSDSTQFENIFKKYYNILDSYAFTILKDNDVAEEVVQNVFYKLWERKENINIGQNLESYLFRSVKNECLNFLEHEKVKSTHHVYSIFQHKQSNNNSDSEGKIVASQLEKNILNALNRLPTQCKHIFELSRYESLKNREIAELLGISIRTVENQMGKALKLMRTYLADFLPLLILFLSLYK